MGSNAVECEFAETKAKIEELEKKIEKLQSEFRAAPEGSKEEHVAKEEKRRLPSQPEGDQALKETTRVAVKDSSAFLGDDHLLVHRMHLLS